MFCSQCGTYNDKTASSCVNCGTQLGDVQNEENVNTAIKADSTENDFEIEIFDDESAETVENVPETAAEEISVKPAEVKEYILWAIVSAILFSIPFGTAAVIFSGFTNSERRMGNLEKAAVYSEKTRFFCVLSTVLASVKLVIGILILVYFTVPDSFLHSIFPF